MTDTKTNPDEKKKGIFDLFKRDKKAANEGGCCNMKIVPQEESKKNDCCNMKIVPKEQTETEKNKDCGCGNKNCC
jgi:hypothetical protein